MAATDLILGFVAGACGSLLLWFTVGRHLMLKYAGQSVINALKDPTEDTKQAIDGLFRLFWQSANTPSIELKKDDEGKAILITPIQSVVMAAGETIMNRLRGLQGSVARASNSVEAAALGIPLPRKGQSTGEFVLEQLLARLTPAIEAKMQEVINNAGKNNQFGGGNQFR